MKKRAFTLSELLVAVAVVAVLASVLVPVLKAPGGSIDKTGMSNQRQIAMAINMYADDFNDTLPRQDGCVRNSSLNPALNGAPETEDPDPKCRNLNNVGFMWRTNHFSWQKWVLPYVKNVQVFQHPSRPLFRNQWNDNGQLMGSFTLNTGLGGQLDTYGDINRARAFRDSWLGGTRSAIPNRDRAWLLNEMGNLLVSYSPILIEDGNAQNRLTVYPAAVREIWGRELMRWKFPDCGGALLEEISNEPNPVATTNGGMTVAFVDGSVRFMSAQEFLRNTPTLQDLGMNLITNQCGFTGGTVRYDRNTPPNVRIDFPMWAFTP